MKNFKIALLMSLLMLCSCSINVNINKGNDFSKEISSPDGTLKMNIACKNGVIKYSLKKNNKTIIEDSALGLETDKFSFSNDMVVNDSNTSNNDSNWTQVWGEQKVINDKNTELILNTKLYIRWFFIKKEYYDK